MKIKIVLLLAVCLSLIENAAAQADFNQGLVLRGRIYDGEAITGKDYVIWKARLAMEFVNNGDKPVILICPGKEISAGQSKVQFWGVRYDRTFEFSKKVTRAGKSAAELQISAELLNAAEPPPNLTVVIKPNESYPFEDYLEVRQNFTQSEELNINGVFYKQPPIWEGTVFDGRKETNPRNHTLPVESLKNLLIRYEISLIKYQIGPDQLEILNARWGKFGVIPVDRNGGLTFVSESIEHQMGYRRVRDE